VHSSRQYRDRHHPRSRGAHRCDFSDRYRHRDRARASREDLRGLPSGGRFAVAAILRHRPRPRHLPAPRARARRPDCLAQHGRQRFDLHPDHSSRRTTMTDQPPLILVVDDYQDAREMYAEYLQFSGFRVAEARNGNEAVDQAFALKPDLILMDLSLPGMDGWEATRQLKADERTRNIPVVALTGH